MAFQKPLLTHPLTPPEMGVQTRCSAYTHCGSLVMMALGPTKGSPKRGVPKTSPPQTLGATHTDTELRIPKSCPAAQEPLEVAASDSLSPGRKGPADDSVSASPKPSLLGVNESPPSQGNRPSASSRSHSSPHGGANPPEKGVKPHLPAGLRAFMKSPQPLRKSSTVPGKQEKDSLNEASKSSVATSKARPAHSGSPIGVEAPGGAGHSPPLGFRAPDRQAGGLPLEAETPETLENRTPETAGNDGVESRSVKRSLSSNKPHLKPALGMNGAKARSQSFSAHMGDKPPTSPIEGPGRVRTQIITNTAERGSSLTRQSSAEGSPGKTPAAPMPEGLPGAGRLPQAPSRQGSLGSAGSACSQQGSPSKLPLRIPPPSKGLLATPGPEDPPACTQEGCRSVAAPEGAGSDPCGGPLPTAGCPRAPQSPGSTQCPSGFETSRTAKLEASGRYPDPSITRTAAASPEAPLSPSIEEKVMLCIQENVEKGQVQTKATSVEAKPRPGPSFASWFGFRRSRLPALSSRKMEVSKPKVEKKDAKGLGFGHKQLKAERKREKKKPELQSEVESELRRDAELAGPPEAGFHSKSSRKAAQDICEQVKFEPRNRPSSVTCPTKDTFMTELLSR